MGSWSTSIMGGDAPLDIEYLFEQRFGEAGVPTADEALEFMTKTIQEDQYEHTTVKQVTAFILMQRGAPMHDEVRRIALEGIAEEDTSDWKDPSERDASLAQFGELVKLYPAEGGRVDLPHQPGLFEKIMGIGS